MNDSTPLKLAVVGAGPVGLALALHAAATLDHVAVTLFDARPRDKDVAGDPRTLALSLGSVQLLQRLGAVLSYGQVVATLQQVWRDAQARSPERLIDRFGTSVVAVRNVAAPAAVEIEEASGIVERFDLAVVAEGGVFSTAVKSELVAGERRPALRRDYGQTAWVGVAEFVPDATGAPHSSGVAYERFTRHGPAALLPLVDGRAGLVWCVDNRDDPVRELDDAQRVAVLNTIFHPRTPRLATVSPMKAFPLGLSAERTLTDGRTVRIGNAAQTLHPVAGQGLNLGLRDAFELVAALAKGRDVDAVLRRLEWQRAPDRWAMIAATDFLARSFTWSLPGLGSVKSAIARQMMFGSR